jgi:hypothetical protein
MSAAPKQPEPATRSLGHPQLRLIASYLRNIQPGGGGERG